jgi:hypothetical protein
LLYSGDAYVADEPKYWIFVKIPFINYSHLSQYSINQKNNAAQTNEWFTDDGTSSSSIANYTKRGTAIPLFQNKHLLGHGELVVYFLFMPLFLVSSYDFS